MKKKVAYKEIQIMAKLRGLYRFETLSIRQSLAILNGSGAPSPLDPNKQRV
jgi:hypothetical protein